MGHTYLIGGDNEISNLQIIKVLCKKLDNKVPRSSGSYFDVLAVKDRPGHDFRYAVDSSKIKELNWKPKVNIDDGLEKNY